MRAAAFWPTVLPLALGACLFVIGKRFVDRTLPGADRLRRMLAATTLVLGLLELSSRSLAAMGRFRATWLLAVLGIAAVTAELILRRRRATGRSGRTPDHNPCWLAATPAIIVGAVAVVLALFAARELPVWAWDAVGYHLPFVNYLVQSGSSAAVPGGLPYVGTYPHGAEMLHAVLRLALPDDTWLDAAQVPFGVIGAAATVGIARCWGAPPAGALVAGAAWLSIPAVFLQLPSGYVDVCMASFLLLSVYWILDAPSPVAISLAGISLGLLLASKPSAPLPVALLGGWLGVRSATRRLWLAASLTIVAVLGLPDYLTNLSRFGNPWWPISLHLGPLHLPGRVTRAELLAAGAHAPRITGSLWSRVLRSWSALRAPPSFDMRIGGLGAATVLLGVPGTLWRLPARPAAMVALLASLAGPDPASADQEDESALRVSPWDDLDEQGTCRLGPAVSLGARHWRANTCADPAALCRVGGIGRIASSPGGMPARRLNSTHHDASFRVARLLNCFAGRPAARTFRATRQSPMNHPTERPTDRLAEWGRHYETVARQRHLDGISPRRRPPSRRRRQRRRRVAFAWMGVGIAAAVAALILTRP